MDKVISSTPTGQVLYIIPLTVQLLQRIKQQRDMLNIQYAAMKLNLQMEKEEDLEQVRKIFEDKMEEEAIKFQCEQNRIRYAYQKLLRNISFRQQWSISASGSSQDPRPTMQPKAPVPTASIPAIHTAQQGAQSRSVLRPQISSNSSRGLSTAPPSTSTVPFWFGPTGTVLPPVSTINQPPALFLHHSLPHLPATYVAAAACNTASTSTQGLTPSAGAQGFRPSTGTPRWHLDRAITAAAPAPAPHFTSLRTHASFVSATSISGVPTLASAPMRFGPSAGIVLPSPGSTPGCVLRAPVMHHRYHPLVIPGTSTTTGLAASSSPASLTSTSRPSTGTFFSHPALTPRAVIQGPSSQLVYPQPYTSGLSVTSTPGYEPARSAVTSNGNINYSTAANSARRNGNGNSDSSSYPNGTSSRTGTVNEDV